MRVQDFLKAVIADKPAATVTPKDNQGDGWIRTRDLMPLFRIRTMGTAREMADRVVDAGFAERRRINRDRVLFRLSPQFTCWRKAYEAAMSQRVQVVPEGWMTLSQLARLMRRTCRGLQYQATEKEIPYKVYNTPRPTRYYQRSRFR